MKQQLVTHHSLCVLLIIVVLIVQYTPVASQDGRAVSEVGVYPPSSSLWIDTDMGLDDVRAITALVAGSERTALLLTTVDGSSSAEAGARNVAGLMDLLGCNTLPVFSGSRNAISGDPSKAPFWRTVCEPAVRDLVKGQLAFRAYQCVPERDAIEQVAHILNPSRGKVTVICLGPLTNLARLLDASPQVAQRIAVVYFQGGNLLNPERDSWNVARDPIAAGRVLASKVPIVLIGSTACSQVRYPADEFRRFRGEGNVTRRVLRATFRPQHVMARLRQGKLHAWDEVVAALVLDHSLGKMKGPYKLKVGDNGATVLTDDSWDGSAWVVSEVDGTGILKRLHAAWKARGSRPTAGKLEVLR